MRQIVIIKNLIFLAFSLKYDIINRNENFSFVEGIDNAANFQDTWR